MHDIIDLEGRGLPGGFVASSEFVEAAEAQANSLGLSPKIKVIYLYNRPMIKLSPFTIFQLTMFSHMTVGPSRVLKDS